jgi:hypothetical protein
MENLWQNYGDVNALEHGGMFVKKDTDINGRHYYVVQLNMVDNEYKWLLVDGYVDLDDSWIEWDSIKATMDTPNDADDERLAVDCMYYYGTHLSNGEDELYESEQEVRERLDQLGIHIY